MISYLEIQQDTVSVSNVILSDSIITSSDSASISTSSDSASISEISDSAYINNTVKTKDSVILKKTSPPKRETSDLIDTTAVCSRNSIDDITFYNPNNIITQIGQEPFNRFPYQFVEKNRQLKKNEKNSIINHLKPGMDLPDKPLHNDWIIGIVLLVAFLYSIIRSAQKGRSHGVKRFFLFKGINDSSSKDVDEIFLLKSTIHNLISFIIIGLFAYFGASYYNYNFFGISGIFLWLIFVSSIIFSVTIRHLICMAVGKISGEKDVFREYIVNIYIFYRFSGLFLFVLIILLVYTSILPASLSFKTGVIVLAIMYLIRVLKLLMIFITRNISIFYLILYLCALEILPALILVKFFSGLT